MNCLSGNQNFLAIHSFDLYSFFFFSFKVTTQEVMYTMNANIRAQTDNYKYFKAYKKKKKNWPK